ncbi:MAG: hypothetical protein ACJ76S_03355 [Solirubrobacteraceae bacterium]
MPGSRQSLWSASGSAARSPSYLGIYLNDHLAGASAALELARRTAANNRSTPLGRALARLAQEIDEDRLALEDVMHRLDVGKDRLKLLVSWGAEKFGRLKLNGELLGYSPLSRLEEIEMLLLGVQGKLALWRMLRHGLGADPRLRGVDLDGLIQRAASQRRRLERHRLRAAQEIVPASDAG